MTNGSSISTPLHSVDQLDLLAGFEATLVPTTSRYDDAADRDRTTALRRTRRDNEVGDGRVVLQLTDLAVDGQLHDASP
jgi:hypothetical protein